MENTNLTVQCIECKLEIPEEANRCHHCGLFQAAWKNELSYVARIAGIFVIAASLITFTLSSLPEVRKVLFWKTNVEIISFVQDQNITVINRGDGEVFLSHIVFTLQTGGTPSPTTSYIINLLAEPGKIIYQDFYKDADRAAKALETLGTTFLDVRDLADEDTLNAVVNMALDEMNDCFSIRFSHETDAKFTEVMKAYEGNLLIIPFKAELIYFSVKDSKKLTKEIPIKAAVLHRNSMSCQGDQPIYEFIK